MYRSLAAAALALAATSSLGAAAQPMPVIPKTAVKPDAPGAAASREDAGVRTLF